MLKEESRDRLGRGSFDGVEAMMGQGKGCQGKENCDGKWKRVMEYE